jgi:hypothetical protein
MNILDIDRLRDDLLLELARTKATIGNPGDVIEILAKLHPERDLYANRTEARSAGWLLVNNSPPLAKTVGKTGLSEPLMLALTASGRSHAFKLYQSKQPLYKFKWIKSISRSEWISVAALVVAIIALFRS